MNSVRLYYIMHNGESDLAQINKESVSQWLSELSMRKRTSVQRLVHNSNRMTSLLGSRLLKMCVQHENIDNFRLSDVQYPLTGKPFWKNDNFFFDFNISHSGNLILIAVSKTLKVGVDAEKVRELKRLTFKKVMSSEELTQIHEKPGLFFELWSKKEAVVKAADTAGLARISDVSLKEGQAVLDETKWCLKRIDLDDRDDDRRDDKYAIHLATSEPVDELIIKHISIDGLISMSDD